MEEHACEDDRRPALRRWTQFIGPLFDTCLHEFAHALFDMLKVPVLGREEDAADQVAAYINLQFGKAEARRLIMGTAYAYANEAERAAPLSLKQFADEHGTPAQRAYNVLCIAYGADPELFGDLVSKGYLPKKRAEGCGDEYGQIADAFDGIDQPPSQPCPGEENLVDGPGCPNQQAAAPPARFTPPANSGTVMIRPGSPAHWPISGKDWALRVVSKCGHGCRRVHARTD